MLGVTACGGGRSSAAPTPNAPVAAERLTERPYTLYSILLNPGTNGLNVGLDSAFLSVQDAALDPGTGRLRTLTRSDVAAADTRELRFNRSAGVFRASLSFGADARVSLTGGRSAAGLVETFRTAADDRAGRYFADLDDRTLAFETDLVLDARSGLEARATLDVDRAGILERSAGVIGFPFRLRGVRVTDPPRPTGEILLRTRSTAAGVAEEPLAPHGFSIAVKAPTGRRFGRASFARPDGTARRYTALLFQAGRSDETTTVHGSPTTTVATVRRPLQALGTAELVVAANGEVVAGALAPTLDGDLGLGLDQVVTTLGGRLFPLEGGVEAASGENDTGLFGGTLTLSDTGPVGGWIRLVELQLAEDASFAVGIATSRLEASVVTTEGGVMTDVQALADLFTLVVLLPNDGASLPATETQGSEYHYLALEPFDPVPAASMTFPEAPLQLGEQRTLRVFNGGDLSAGRAALGPTGGGQTFGLGQFLVGILGVGEDLANRYRMVGRTDTATFSQIGSWEAPGRSDLFAGHSFQFGTSGVNALVPDLLGGRLGDFAVLGAGGALGVGLSSFDNPAGSRYFVLIRRRVVDPIGVDVLLDLFR